MASILYYGSSTQIHSGASQWMFRMADQMRDRGHTVRAVLPANEGVTERYRRSEIEVVEHWSEPLRRRRSALGQFGYVLFGLVAAFQLALYIRRNDVDVVHVNDVRFFPGLVAGKLGNARCICHVRAIYESELLRSVLAGLVVRLSDRVLCVSERTQEIMFEEVGYATDNVGVLHDCVPEPERFESLDGTSFREEHGIGPGEIVVAHVSKLTENKAQDRVLDAAERVVERTDDVRFVLVGGEVDGHEEFANEIRRRADGVDAVHVAGFVPDVTEALAASDVSVHVPRHEDPFPGVVLEGMLAGNPVVGSRSGGIPEQIDECETGYLVPKARGIEETAGRIRQLCEDDEHRREMGETAARRCRERFPPAAYFQSLDQTYRDALAE
jgi:glycosyltransferase involved in cell wall biosynthesis